MRTAISPDEPQESLGGGVLLRLELVHHQLLDRPGLGGGSKKTVTDFLNNGKVGDSVSTLYRTAAWKIP